MLNLKNLWLAMAIISLAIMLIGSRPFDPEAAAANRHPAVEPALSIAAEIPAVHREEWRSLAAEKPLYLFRCGVDQH